MTDKGQALLYRALCVGLIVLAIGWRIPQDREWPLPFHRDVQYESVLGARLVYLSVRSEWGALSPAERTWLDGPHTAPFTAPPLLQSLTALGYLLLGRKSRGLRG